jgi:phospholipid/cholesterol/gamma-HCH transport system substrate-binding protein
MDFKFRHSEKIVGVFVFLALIVLIVGIVMVAVSRKMFVKTHSFETKLSDATGLSTSTPLNFKGFRIGRVRSFKLDENNDIVVKLGVYDEYRAKIVGGSAIYRQTNPITGETSLVLLMPKPAYRVSEVLPKGSYIPSLDKSQGQRMLESGKLERGGDTISILFDDAKSFFENLRQEFKLKKDSFRNFFKGMGEVSDSFARNREIFDHLHKLLNPEGGPVFNTVDQIARVTQRLDKTVTELQVMLENYKNPDGLMLKMLQLDRGRLDQTVKNLNGNLVALREMLNALKDQSPLLAEVLEKSRKTLEAVNNNPLLRGGISKDGKKGNAGRKKRLDIDEEK